MEAVVQVESSKLSLISGNESTQLQWATFKSGRGGSLKVKSSLPAFVPAISSCKVTRFPFQVNWVTDFGAKKAIDVVELMSPKSSKVEPEIVAFRTRYGPIIKTDGSVAAMS